MRLIDADALFERAYEIWGIEADASDTSIFMEAINNAPTVEVDKRWRNIFQDAVRTWGEEAQIKMLFEEIGELMQAVCKAGRVKNWEQRMKVWSNIAEEIADVSIMLGQMALLFDVEDSVENQKREKIARLAERLEEAHAAGGKGDV